MFSRIFVHTQRKHLLPLALGIVSLLTFFAGCTLSGSPSANNTSGTTGIVLNTGANASPPPFPPFTIGAWVHDQTPQKGEKNHLYVFARIQSADMTSPAKPAVGLTINVVIDGTSQNQPTDADGSVKFDFDSNATPTTPSVINVYATYNNVQYTTTTFYTVLPEIAITPAPSGTVTVTPTAGKGP